MITRTCTWKIGDFVQPMDQEDRKGLVVAVRHSGRDTEGYDVHIEGHGWHHEDTVENAN